MSRSLEIINNNTINPAFFKANRFLITSHKDHLNTLSDDEKIKFIKKMWNDMFHAVPIQPLTNNIWTDIEFFSERDMIMFWMKWKN